MIMFYDKIMKVQCDSEIFFNETDVLKGYLLFDYDTLIEDYPNIFREIKRNYPRELKALKDGDINYLAVYSICC